MAIPVKIKAPVVSQNLYFVGMRYTTASFVAALSNAVHAVAFVMAWIFRLEILNLRCVRSHAKIMVTAITIGGAVIMALVHGPVLSFPWTHRGGVTPSHNHDVQQTIKGAALIMAECFSWLSFMIIHAVTLKSYPAELSLTVWICILGAFEGAI
ncbi:PREDICTED: WAT1-related protein At2g37460-like [Erythranthe guttata]|uniref:WAT1-related protein At2g37460-like n=1 Tax=Erythranthe guttata TaxID=4155 RepID=UPI00064D7E18|nr:PREDICTED: WAT1-related protein At2g37460-like [Erythranthe guttata]|eukprot:XP_012835776.1 PREDICTED: WAT1-related protein At2g37460-like [Erythranthe guttata]